MKAIVIEAIGTGPVYKDVDEPARHPGETLVEVAAAPLNLTTAGLLPPSIRQQYRFAWDTRRERRLQAFFATAGLFSRLVPRPLRELPSRYAVTRTKSLTPPRFLQARPPGQSPSRRAHSPSRHKTTAA